MICKTKPIKKRGVPIFYLHIYRNIKEKTKDELIPKKAIYIYLYHYRVPKIIRFQVLNEMIKYGLFENKGKKVIIR